MIKKYTLLSCLCLSFLAACSSNSDKKTNNSNTLSEADKAKIDSTLIRYNPKNEDKFIADFVKKLHQKSGFNGNVLVAKKGKIIFEKAIGWADYLHRDSLKINSQFELASITKTFTGVAIMQLIEAKKLSLNDNVKKF
ncbi:beta-lactamase family protein, partial [Pelobium sp.]